MTEAAPHPNACTRGGARHHQIQRGEANHEEEGTEPLTPHTTNRLTQGRGGRIRIDLQKNFAKHC